MEQNKAAMDVLFGAASEVSASNGQLSSISALIQEESATVAELETAEAMVEAAKAKVNNLRQNLIPTAMMEAGVAEFVDANTGCKAKLAIAVSGSLGSPKTPAEEAAKERKLDILIEHGADEIVKLILSVPFGKGGYNQATALQSVLAKQDALPKQLASLAEHVALSPGQRQACQEAAERLEAVQGLQSTLERSIHHQTLISWLKKRMEAGAEIPMDDLGLWYGQIAKIERPKANA